MTEHKRFATLTELFEYLCEEAGARVAYEAGETIYKQGQPDNRVYQVQSGGIAQSKRNRTGDVMTYQVLHPGDILSTYNLSSNVINQPCSAKALIKSELRQVLRASFKQHIRHNPDLLLKIVDLVSENLPKKTGTENTSTS
ncbi:MAG: Crp/Fnr family transcriptional regulator [Candidatus Bipolaricaulota bacterium]